MTAHSFGTNAPQSLAPSQRGVVLFIALIVMVVMSLAALGLIRSVGSTSGVIGNLALRQSAILPASYAVEVAAASLFADANPLNAATIPDVRADFPAQNYYATKSQPDDQYGVPLPLQTKAAAAALARQIQSNCGSADPLSCDRITYVTERLCNPAAPIIPAGNGAAGTWCDMGQPKQAPGTTVNQPNPLTLPQQVFYRVTVRVDGPLNTVSFMQAMLR